MLCLVILILTVSATGWAELVVYVGSSGRTEVVDTENPGAHAMPAYPPVTTGKAGGVIFYVFYQDVISNNNRGFDDPTNGAARQARVSDVVAYLATVLIHPDGVCDVKFEASQVDGGGALAEGGTYFSETPGFTNGIAFDHITTGVDPSGSIPDIYVTVDFGWPWYQGTGTPPFDRLDFASVMLHEITHGLGIVGLSDAAGASVISLNVYSYWDGFLQTGNGQDLFGGAPPSFLGVAGYLVGNANGVRFNGANAIAAFGSKPPIYAPDPFQPGSSLAHWNTGGKIAGNAVMEPVFYYGEMIREYAPVDAAALKNIGYSIQAGGEGELFSGFLVSQNPMGWYEEGSPLALSVRLTGAVLPIMSYQWMLNGGDILDATLSTYGKDHVSDADKGAYTCAVTDSGPGKAMIIVGPFVVSVFPPGSLPAAGIAGLGLAAACAIAGAVAVFRRTG